MSANLQQMISGSVPLSPRHALATPGVDQTPEGQIAPVVGALVSQYATMMPKASRTPDAIERMKEIALGILRTNRGLMRVATSNPMGLCNALLAAAKLDIDLTPALGLAYLIPRGGEVCFQLSYRGIIELARRSGKISKVYAELVFPGDTFEASRGTDPHIAHRPDYFGAERSDEQALGVYAVAVYTDGTTDFEVLSRDEVARARAVSKVRSGPWDDWWGEMAKKTAIHRLAKRLPKSREAAQVLALDIGADTPAEPRIRIDARPVTPQPQAMPAISVDPSQPFDVADEGEPEFKG